jgi:hypothetical protein
MNSERVRGNMKGKFLLGSGQPVIVGNIYADKSSIVLDWLLRIGIDRKGVSLREVAKGGNVSVGLVQRVFRMLVLNGLLQTEGTRTSKRFFLTKPHLLLKSWIDHYSILKKCKMWTYQSSLGEKTQIMKTLKASALRSGVTLALHSAAEAYGCKNTNLNTLELYVVDPAIRTELEHTLELERQERGYEVLIIEPYYKTLLSHRRETREDITIAPPILTFLDLYHFPLRGQEQAEFMAERLPELQRIYRKG